MQKGIQNLILWNKSNKKETFADVIFLFEIFLKSYKI